MPCIWYLLFYNHLMVSLTKTERVGVGLLEKEQVWDIYMTGNHYISLKLLSCLL